MRVFFPACQSPVFCLTTVLCSTVEVRSVLPRKALISFYLLVQLFTPDEHEHVLQVDEKDIFFGENPDMSLPEGTINISFHTDALDHNTGTQSGKCYSNEF